MASLKELKEDKRNALIEKYGGEEFVESFRKFLVGDLPMADFKNNIALLIERNTIETRFSITCLQQIASLSFQFENPINEYYNEQKDKRILQLLLVIDSIAKSSISWGASASFHDKRKSMSFYHKLKIALDNLKSDDFEDLSEIIELKDLCKVSSKIALLHNSTNSFIFSFEAGYVLKQDVKTVLDQINLISKYQSIKDLNFKEDVVVSSDEVWMAIKTILRHSNSPTPDWFASKFQRLSQGSVFDRISHFKTEIHNSIQRSQVHLTDEEVMLLNLLNDCKRIIDALVSRNQALGDDDSSVLSEEIDLMSEDAVNTDPDEERDQEEQTPTNNDDIPFATATVVEILRQGEGQGNEAQEPIAELVSGRDPMTSVISYTIAEDPVLLDAVPVPDRWSNKRL